MVRRIFLYNNSKGYVTSPFPFSGTTPTLFQQKKMKTLSTTKTHTYSHHTMENKRQMGHIAHHKKHSNQWIHLSKVMSIFINKSATGFSCRFLNFVKVLCILLLSPNVKRCGLSIWTKLNPLYQGMLFAKFGWNWPSGSIDWRKFLLFCNYLL